MRTRLILVVSGCREGVHRRLLDEALDGYNALHTLLALYEGCAPGVDTQSWQWAQRAKVKVEHHPAPWSHLQRAAGPVRNRSMLTAAQLAADLLDVEVRLAAFHQNYAGSRGTKDMVGYAQKVGVPVDTYGFTP